MPGRRSCARSCLDQFSQAGVLRDLRRDRNDPPGRQCDRDHARSRSVQPDMHRHMGIVPLEMGRAAQGNRAARDPVQRWYDRADRDRRELADRRRSGRVRRHAPRRVVRRPLGAGRLERGRIFRRGVASGRFGSRGRPAAGADDAARAGVRSDRARPDFRPGERTDDLRRRAQHRRLGSRAGPGTRGRPRAGRVLRAAVGPGVGARHPSVEAENPRRGPGLRLLLRQVDQYPSTERLHIKR